MFWLILWFSNFRWRLTPAFPMCQRIDISEYDEFKNTYPPRQKNGKSLIQILSVCSAQLCSLFIVIVHFSLVLIWVDTYTPGQLYIIQFSKSFPNPLEIFNSSSIRMRKEIYEFTWILKIKKCLWKESSRDEKIKYIFYWIYWYDYSHLHVLSCFRRANLITLVPSSVMKMLRM